MKTRFFCITILLWACAACPADPVQEKVDRWILRVGDQIVPEAQIILAWAQNHVFEIENWEERRTGAKHRVEQLGFDEAFVVKATTSGLRVSEEELSREMRRLSAGFSVPQFNRLLHQENWTKEHYKKQLKKRLLVKKYFQKKQEGLPQVREEEIQAYYQEKFLSQVNQDEVKVRHLLVDTREEASYVLEKLLGTNAMPFEVAARRFSKAPEADRGGELNWFGRGTLPPVFDICFDLKENEISQVVESEYGFHLLKMQKRRKGKPQSLEKKRDYIAKVLRQSKEENLVNEEKKALLDQFVIRIHQENLTKRLQELSQEFLSGASDKEPSNEKVKNSHEH